jgi:dolichol-phosphate mannosyltransferase
VLHRPLRNGLGRAYMDGFRYAIENTDSQYIMTMDADMSHDPSFIPEFLLNIQSCDVVNGSRYYNGRISIVNWPMTRLLLSYAAGIYIRFFTKIRLSDPTSGFRCFNRSTMEKILRQGIISNGYAFSIEINYLCHKWGLKIREIPIVFHDRNKGASKMHKIGTMFEAMAIVWRMKFIRLISQ